MRKMAPPKSSVTSTDPSLSWKVDTDRDSWHSVRSGAACSCCVLSLTWPAPLGCLVGFKPACGKVHLSTHCSTFIVQKNGNKLVAIFLSRRPIPTKHITPSPPQRCLHARCLPAMISNEEGVLKLRWKHVASVKHGSLFMDHGSRISVTGNPCTCSSMPHQRCDMRAELERSPSKARISTRPVVKQRIIPPSSQVPAVPCTSPSVKL